MKKISRILALVAFFATLPVAADVAIKDVLLRRAAGGDDINVRVVVRNRARTTQAGPVKLTLWLRANGTAEWEMVKEWEDIAKLGAGESVSRDLFTAGNEVLKGATSNPDLQAKARVEAPGTKSDTKTVSNTGYQK